MVSKVGTRSVIFQLAIVRLELYIKFLFFFLEFSNPYIYFANFIV